MAKINLTEAFALYGAAVSRSASIMSAVAADGAIILKCSSRRFSRLADGVLRYEDALSGGTGSNEALRVLREHLALAQEGSLPVRLIVVTESESRGGTKSRVVHIRQDLVGSVVDLDEARYVVDFVRAHEPESELA